MALLRAFVAGAIVAVSVHAILATEYVVGDAKGWSLNFNYQAWAEGKEFHVGDKLGKLTLNTTFVLHLSLELRFFYNSFDVAFVVSSFVFHIQFSKIWKIFYAVSETVELLFSKTFDRTLGDIW